MAYFPPSDPSKREAMLRCEEIADEVHGIRYNYGPDGTPTLASNDDFALFLILCKEFHELELVIGDSDRTESIRYQVEAIEELMKIKVSVTCDRKDIFYRNDVCKQGKTTGLPSPEDPSKVCVLFYAPENYKAERQLVCPKDLAVLDQASNAVMERYARFRCEQIAHEVSGILSQLGEGDTEHDELFASFKLLDKKFDELALVIGDSDKTAPFWSKMEENAEAIGALEKASNATAKCKKLADEVHNILTTERVVDLNNSERAPVNRKGFEDLQQLLRQITRQKKCIGDSIKSEPFWKQLENDTRIIDELKLQFGADSSDARRKKPKLGEH